MSDASFMQISQSFISYTRPLQVEISVTKWDITPGRVHVAPLLHYITLHYIEIFNVA